MDIVETFERDGYLLINGGIHNTLLEQMREGMKPLFAWREQHEKVVSRHQTILQPEFCHRSFMEFLNLESINQVAESILGPEMITAGLAVLFGTREPQLCPWHRDFHDGKAETPDLLKPENGRLSIQFNGAVYDDPSLWVVPGSHRRPTTAAEREYTGEPRGGGSDPFDETDRTMREVLSGMPAAIHVNLKAGDCLLYNPMLWHAAEYRPEWKRATMHGGWKRKEGPDRFAAMRWGFNHNPWLFGDLSYLGDPGPYFGPQLERYRQSVANHFPDFVENALRSDPTPSQ
ncbi:MAG: phytanoyl-CoA dioxygenase family protein [Planctomycetota bacterium]|nr:phytanoyl-CoA dioxygenase family protein [Planctomycetota bacterium]MDA1139942.1 phytanoyl-CoA dioxygenase family protein [Planctomycetota bacterium]